jgi:septal ring factor EnvC (AmiA/AmiB activator)
MHAIRNAIRAAALLAASFSLAAGGSQGVGVALRDYFLAATPSTPSQPQAATGLNAARADRLRPTKGLENAIADLNHDPKSIDHDDRKDIRDELDEEIDAVEQAIDDIREELREARHDLNDIDHKDGVKGSKQLAAAEAKWDALNERRKALDDRLNVIERQADIGIKPFPLIVEAKKLGTDIVLLRLELRPLRDLIRAAERLEKD